MERYEGMRYKVRKTDSTKIVWNQEFEIYQCEKCKSILHYQFDFRYCPYCRRAITHADERRTGAMVPTGFGVVYR